MPNDYQQIKFIKTNIDVQTLKNKYKGTDKELIMNTIFDKLDALDTYGYESDGIIETAEFCKIRNFIKDFYGDPNYNYKKKFGSNVEKNDVEKAIEDVINANESKINDITKDYPEFLKNSIKDENDKINVVEKNGKTFYELQQFSQAFGEHTFTFDENGNILKFSTVRHTFIMKDGVKDFESVMQHPWPNSKIGITNQQNGVKDIKNLMDNTLTRNFGKTSFKYNLAQNGDKSLDSVILNNGMVNKVNMTFDYDDNGKVKDIHFNEQKNDSINTKKYENSPIKFDNNFIKISQAEKQELIDLINSNASIGMHYDLKVVGNKIDVVPAIIDKDGNYVDSIPNSLIKDHKELMKQGMYNLNDFDYVVNDDGSIKMDMKSAKAKGYDYDNKTVTYSKDGKSITTTTIKDDQVVAETISKNVKTMNSTSREGVLLESLLTKDYEKFNELLGDETHFGGRNFDIYGVIDKYQNLSGKNLMSELLLLYEEDKIDEDVLKKIVTEGYPGYYKGRSFIQESFDRNMSTYKKIKSYNPKSSQVSNLLYNAENKNIVSNNKYTQTLNNKNYTVDRNGKNITVSCNETKKSISLESLPDKVIDAISELNPIALYQLALKGTKIELTDEYLSHEVYGAYLPNKNKIVLNIANLSKQALITVLTHEIGHSFYSSYEFGNNELLKNTFNKEYEKWDNLETKPEVFKNVDYCADNTDEFFAEAYTLITTRHCDSEYTICEYFPETLKIVKEMIENKF